MATSKTVKKAAQEPTPAPKAASGSSRASKDVGGAVSVKAASKSDKTAAKKVTEPTMTTDPVQAACVESEAVASALPASGGKWKEIQQILLAMKEQTLLEIKRSIKKGSEASVGEEPTGDIYDQASSERDRELGLLLNDRDREKVHSIDEALLRIAEGEYGICEECDEEIPMGRLKVLPFTRHCVKCKSDLEKFQAQTRRIEEDRAYREIPVGDDDEG